MARIFTSNQVNHVYVVKDVKSTKASIANVGDVHVAKDAENNPFVTYKGWGGIVRTDIIENFMYAKCVDASVMRKYLTNAFIAFDSNISLTAGADYVLNIEMQNPMGISPDNTYLQSAVARAFTGDTKYTMYAKLAKNLAQNFSRLETPLFEVYVTTASTAAGVVFSGGSANVTAVTKDTDLTTLSGNYTAIVLKELPSEWILGLKQDKPLVYDISSSYIVHATANTTFEEEPWAVLTAFEGNALNNGHAMADLEFFAMGERADQYRMSGWPNYIPTKYVADPDKEYDVISIHYAYVGSNEAVQKSEKEVTFLCERSNSDVGVWKKSGSSDIEAAYTDAAVAAKTSSFGSSIDTVAEAEAAGWKWYAIGGVANDLRDAINALNTNVVIP